MHVACLFSCNMSLEWSSFLKSTRRVCARVCVCVCTRAFKFSRGSASFCDMRRPEWFVIYICDSIQLCSVRRYTDTGPFEALPMGGGRSSPLVLRSISYLSTNKGADTQCHSSQEIRASTTLFFSESFNSEWYKAQQLLSQSRAWMHSTGICPCMSVQTLVQRFVRSVDVQ